MPADSAAISKSIPALDRGDAVAFLWLVVFLLGAFYSVIFTSYAYLDDYFWLDLSQNSPADLYQPQIVQGRPLNALILEGTFKAARTIPRLRGVRAITLAGMSVMGWMFYLAMKRGGWDRRLAMWVAILASTVPAMQVYAAWADSVGIPISGIAAAGAAIMTGRAMNDLRRHWVLLIGAAVLMLISATIYQPTAMVFWPIAAVELLGNNRRDNRGGERNLLRRFAVYLAVAAAGLLLAWYVFQYGLAHIAKRPSLHRGGMTHDPLGKITWFFRYPLVDALNLFNLRPNLLVVACVGGFILIGLVQRFVLRGQWVGLVIILALLPLSYLPNLLIEENWSSYRTQIGLVWLILLLGAWTLCQLWPKKSEIFLAPAMGLVAVIAVIFANWHVQTLIVIPQHDEMLRLQDEIGRLNLATIRRIAFLQPAGASGFAPYSRYDEFGRTSMYASWVPQSAVNLLVQETYPRARRIPVDLQPFSAPFDPASLSDGTGLINLRALSGGR